MKIENLRFQIKWKSIKMNHKKETYSLFKMWWKTAVDLRVSTQMLRSTLSTKLRSTKEAFEAEM